MVCKSAPVEESQIRTVPSKPPDASREWSGDNLIERISALCPTRSCSSVPVFGSQILIVPSSEADATLSCHPSHHHRTDSTTHVCPRSVCKTSPLSRSQILTVRSSDPEISRRPSGEKATVLTRESCPLSSWSN